MTDTMVFATAPGELGSQSDAPVDELEGYLTCVEVADVTHDVKSFSFEQPGSASLRFLPGQYLTFRLLVDGERVERCYTISSAPTRPERLTITVKRVPGGKVSGWLHENLRVGDAIGAAGPLGRFSYANHPGERYLFLTAGSGITPAMSMVRTLRGSGDPAGVVFVHCARTPDDIIFRAELEEIATEPRVDVVFVCEADSPAEHWAGLRGRLDPQVLLAVAPDLVDRETFTCGPPPFMDAVRSMLGALGAGPHRCHEESFELGGGAPTADLPVRTGTTFRIDLRRSGSTIECDAGTTVLEAAARAGVTLPSSCGEGMCGTCKLTLLRGEVDMQHAGGIRRREIEQRKFLACCSTPLEDLEIEA
jgi:ferredoxin-NADP reductase